MEGIKRVGQIKQGTEWRHINSLINEQENETVERNLKLKTLCIKDLTRVSYLVTYADCSVLAEESTQVFIHYSTFLLFLTVLYTCDASSPLYGIFQVQSECQAPELDRELKLM